MVQSGIELPYKPPYRWDQVLEFLQGRTIDGVESIQDGVYARTALVTDRAGDLHRGWLQVENNANQNVLHLNLSDSLEPVQDLVEAEIRRQFDLDNDPHVVHDHLAGLSEIHPSLPVLGTRVPGAFDPFEMAVRAVLGRQITVTFARKLANRITQEYGTPIRTGHPGLTHTFPTPRKVLSLSDGIEDHFGRLGVLSARSRTIASLAEGIDSGWLDLEHPVDPDEQYRRLLSIKGIGPWTAGYIGMRTLGLTDTFLETDAGIKKAVAPLTPRESALLAQQWSPFRTYATFSLWNSLSPDFAV